MINVVGVVLNEKGKQYYFLPGKVSNLEKDMSVIVETEKGTQFGTVLTPNIDLPQPDVRKELKTILRIATEKDIEKNEENKKQAKEAIVNCKKIIGELSLKMTIVDAYFTFEREQLVFNFLADNRVDFRDLVKKLATIYKTRIELRQIGVRDKSKEIGGLAMCGREFCCKSMNSDFDSVSINMAKNQNISLSPSKINGACGRLLCCLKYEDSLYKENKAKLPKIGDRVNTKKGVGKVISINTLDLTYKVEIPKYGIMEIKDES